MYIVGAAETGSGKTLAFGIPIIQGILGDRRYEETHAEQVGDEEGVGEELE
jgi:superfamily II DNA/RNA helicase